LTRQSHFSIVLIHQDCQKPESSQQWKSLIEAAQRRELGLLFLGEASHSGQHEYKLPRRASGNQSTCRAVLCQTLPTMGATASLTKKNKTMSLNGQVNVLNFSPFSELFFLFLMVVNSDVII
jgi:hypothetical protein